VLNGTTSPEASVMAGDESPAMASRTAISNGLSQEFIREQELVRGDISK
jgi:hypothetical protein